MLNNNNMPRKAKNKLDDSQLNEKNNKRGLMNTIVKDITVIDTEDVILQLPITNKILEHNECEDNLIIDPEPYEPNCFYINQERELNLSNIQDNIIDCNEYNIFQDTFNITKTTNNCYWCCHPIENRTYGMPYKYNSITDTYFLYGCFCSLHCANAYNFSVHCGSDKVWEINSFIQMLSKHFGYLHPIRPAPSRFLLKIFNGPMSIEEFRRAHMSNDKTHILNLPPMISTSHNYEVINTSYLKNITDNMNNVKPMGKKVIKNTIDSKLNLIIT
jgi:hypothetical protein